MRRIIAFSATAILLSSAAMADDTVADSNSGTTPEQLELNAAGFLFDDSIREDGEADPDGDEAADGDRGNDEDSSDDKDQETEDEKDDD
ncbi:MULTISPECIES: hypothetical protein [Roseovarius]|uniref:hypothetical protein n=1 Tax=Roseovarius TaxID=74030 RepID=UPI00273F433E|nr:MULTISPECIES: hypothetical protein [unclassified Roseovarius]